MKQLSIPLFLFLFAFSAHSQSMLNIQHENGVISKIRPEEAAELATKNTEAQYLHPEFQEAIITWRGETFKSMVKYNVYENFMLAQVEGDVYGINFEDNTKVKIGGYSFQKSPLNDLGIVDIMYSENDVHLIRKLIVKYIEAREGRDSFVEAKPASFHKESDEFYLIVNNKAHELKSKKKLLKTLEVKNAEKFVKENDLDFGKEDDLLKFAQFVALNETVIQ